MINNRDDFNEKLFNNPTNSLSMINAVRILITFVLLMLFNYSLTLIESGSIPSLDLLSPVFLLKAGMMFVLAFIIAKIYDTKPILQR